MLPLLNLPAIEPRLQQSKGKVWIFDGIRKKFVLLTPEEWVRQHVVNFLLLHNYPKALVKVEGGLTVYDLQKRSDIVVYSREGKAWMVVECKNPFVRLDEATLSQVANYNTTLKANYIMISNGLQQVYFKTDWGCQTVERVDGLPVYP